MKLVKTKSPIELLEYLEFFPFKQLPKALWDDNLFLYNKLLRLMSLSVEDELFNCLQLFKVVNEDAVDAIGLYDLHEQSLYYVGEYIEGLKMLIQHIKQGGTKLTNIKLINEKIADECKTDSRLHLSYAQKKYYRVNQLSSIHDKLAIKEIKADTAHLLWEGVETAMEEGIRYFGGFIGNEIKCCAGISRISKLRSEIIAVHTFHEDDRKKGYASSLCRNLINLALETSDVVTWTCNYTNIASMKTANKLGMTPYLTEFNFQYNEHNEGGCI